jgi:hypothetical protein
MRWFDKATAPHWQCSSAPSSLNRTYFFGHVKASNTFLEMNHLFLSTLANEQKSANVLVLLVARLVAVAAATVD